ncbi:hypothetical protein [Amycolatopsis australiensis]|uniref:Uncharacterized protein n=1 Tax=Amycolatopsis australiensis TaxID=546364 RepID=A0A1K1RRP4_9PSEU|nr:hypothetical protein [Amycolatopsis australiensis]SFW74816.1 hypothetical protein SAMN04489730_3834 [Amycolatopsis australiensis]
MLTTTYPFRRFLRTSFATLADGGYAGLVFLVSRSADAPRLHRRFFQEWSDIHDVTGPYLAVITPSPGSSILLDEELYRTQYGALVPDVSCPSGGGRLSRAVNRRWPSSVRMTEVTPSRTASVRRHQDTHTTAVNDLQEFFGIPESLLPCAVIVSLHETSALCVALDDESSMYRLLKSIKAEIEPATARISRKEQELVEAKAARARIRNEQKIGELRATLATLQAQWTDQKLQLAADLDATAGDLADDDATRCRWLAGRLRTDQPLSGEEREQARQAARALRGRGRLEKRIRRALPRLDARYPAGTEVAARLAAAEAAEDAAQDRIGGIKQDLDDLGRDLALNAAVVSAAANFGLVPDGDVRLREWRELAWPISVLARPKRATPRMRFRWS